ncbi:hypothetical protein HSBAA_24400 [Vreelandella sulfidaeris]|uniref:Uncharacterized protein n=1 Tax=Vreelandella sulfidaeris TaxID=115553 RepID=A0A455UD98_9GAMM|nr:hypothetical protein HSBAA_24400 [Halomonas sulfidaeris]
MERYQADLERDDFQYDPAQELAVKHLQRLYDELVSAPTPMPKALVANKGLKAKMAGLIGKRRHQLMSLSCLGLKGSIFGVGWGVERPT